MMWDDIALEVAIIERLARENVRQKIASQQLGEAWVGIDERDTAASIPAGNSASNKMAA